MGRVRIGKRLKQGGGPGDKWGTSLGTNFEDPTRDDRIHPGGVGSDSEGLRLPFDSVTPLYTEGTLRLDPDLGSTQSPSSTPETPSSGPRGVRGGVRSHRNIRLVVSVTTGKDT